ncbi:MAG: nitroreductase family protein [Candidatus Hodarchaeales archaeon]|jgi:nitroreductase
MMFKDLAEKRRAFRSLKQVDITPELIEKAASVAQLAPSCMNNQPWRFVFVYDKGVLTELQNNCLTRGNAWGKASSLIIAVFSKTDLDCMIKDRQYYLFDTGMATAYLILHLTDIGLVAHPIAGYDPEKTKELLNIPEEYQLITLVIVGKKSNAIPDFFRDHQKKSEVERPKRKNLDEFVFMNRYSE